MERRSVPYGGYGAGSAAVPVVSVKRPVAGIRFGDGDLIPPDSLRRCKVCKQPIEHLDARRVTCGHPRCQRANRNSKRLRPGTNPSIARAATDWQDHYQREKDDEDRALTAKVTRGYAYAMARGADQKTALAWVAKGTGLSMIQVQIVLKENE